MAQAGSGIPTGCISVMNGYTHSPVEMLDSRDLEGALTLRAREPHAFTARAIHKRLSAEI